MKARANKKTAESGEKIYIDAGVLPVKGLTGEEVAEKSAHGEVNGDVNIKTKSVATILRTNIFTFFNILFVIIAVIMAFFIEPDLNGFSNYGFLPVAVVNCLIGIVQELAAKRTIDKLSLLSQPKTYAVRDGKVVEIPLQEIVSGEVLRLTAGAQIVADAVVVAGNIEVNEALITGEPDAVVKRLGDELLSGSFVVSGEAYAEVRHLGKENYAAKITADAKKQKPQNSEIYTSLNKIIKFMSLIIVPLGAALFCVKHFVQEQATPLNDTVLSVLATLIGMIPSGLVALTSAVFCLSVIRLARKKALAQDLYCAEVLARVDVLCLDKTGTITEGSMRVTELKCLSGDEENICGCLKALTRATGDDNPTANAVKEFVKDVENRESARSAVPFSSRRKWSGANFERYSLVMGAPEFVLKKVPEDINTDIQTYAKEGYRVMLLASSEGEIQNNSLPDLIKPLALIIIEDVIRKGAEDTLRYFDEQGVTIKIISGDNPVTVAAVAARAGVKNAEKYVDASTLGEEELRAAAEEYTVFGRVSPDQKLLLVKALKGAGHVVGMTGDGINDVLALREADCSIAVAAGSDASKNVSKIVLLDNDFGSVPSIVAEGRRCINNLQRSASLFLVKTIYNTLFALLFMMIPASLPFTPNNLMLIGYITIGPPAFILALEPNHDIVSGRFLPKVIRNACPAAFAIVIAVCIIAGVAPSMGLDADRTATSALIATAAIGLSMIIKISYPFNILRIVMIVLLAGFAATCFFVPFLRTVFGISGEFVPAMLTLTLPVTLGGIALFIGFTALSYKIKFPEKLPPGIQKLADKL